MVTSNNEITNILQPESNFITEVEICVSKDCDIFDCIQSWCESRNIEYEQVVSIIKTNQQFRLKVTRAAESLNYLKRKKKR